MKKSSVFLWVMTAMLVVAGGVAWVTASAADSKPPVSKTKAALGAYSGGPGQLVVLASNNLGMHCINSSFKDMAILPPYNTVTAQVILRGNPPRLITAGVTMSYAVQKTSIAQTDFWTFAKPLFGVNLAPGIGLTGLGLSGPMTLVDDRFIAEGIPVIPYTDKGVWNPWQKAVLTVKTRHGTAKTVPIVLPVSDELRCDNCHADNGDANPDTATGAVETNILTLHDARNATTLMAQRPVLCASCHADVAIGAAGKPEQRNLSLSMHGWHGSLADDQPGCYDCHPGPKTQCLRTAIDDMGMDSPEEPGCEKCHGTLPEMATALAGGRRPWVDEPTCEQCHGPNYSTGGVLYREARGHGGLRCVTCHNSPHAWWPSELYVDDLQPLKLQHAPWSIGQEKCTICHTKKMAGSSPHVKFKTIEKK